MNDSIIPSNASPSTLPPGARINWGAVVGFGALALLWPLAGLIGLTSLIGGLATAIIVIVTIGVAWIVGVGFGRVPRPVITLTLAGVVAGVLVTILSAILGETSDRGPGILLLAAVIEIGRGAGLGALAGLAAAAIQKARS